MVHGDSWGFDSAFAGGLGGSKPAPNVATWLARRGVDVWGIDLRWTLVAQHTPDRTFMRSWGPRVDIQDIRVATSVERTLRARTGSGSGRTALLGWSRGGFLAYAYAAYETHLAQGQRNVNALIPADTVLRYAPRFDQFRRATCSAYGFYKKRLAHKGYAINLHVFARLGQLALTDPGGGSPLISGLSNRQAALDVGAAPDPVFSPWYHFVGGTFDSKGTPTGLTFTPALRFFQFLSQGSPWEATRDLARSSRVWCGKPDRLVANVRAIHLPVLYLGAAGGFGITGLYSTTLLGSRDVKHHIARLRPKGHQNGDFGHVDLWQAANAPRVAWRPLLHWLLHH
jgi:hypothetical protein